MSAADHQEEEELGSSFRDRLYLVRHYSYDDIMGYLLIPILRCGYEGDLHFKKSLPDKACFLSSGAELLILLEVFSIFVGYSERLGKHYTYICISSGRLLSCSDMQCIHRSASCYSKKSLSAHSEENHMESY